MKVALVLSVAAPDAHRFGWKWQSEDGKGRSRETFRYFFECCEDARKAGYECKFAGGESTDPEAPAPAVDLRGARSA